MSLISCISKFSRWRDPPAMPSGGSGLSPSEYLARSSSAATRALTSAMGTRGGAAGAGGGVAGFAGGGVAGFAGDAGGGVSSAPTIDAALSSSAGSTIASGSGSGSGSGLYSVSLFPLRARTMETPRLALAHRDAAAEGSGASAAAAAASAAASAAAFAASASMDAGMRKLSGTASAVSGFDPNAVAVFTNLPAFFQSAPMSFLGASGAASPSAGASAGGPNARPPGTPFAPVARIALTCKRVAFFHFASLSTGAAAASPPSAGAASSAGGASSGGGSTGASPSASAIEPVAKRAGGYARCENRAIPNWNCRNESQKVVVGFVARPAQFPPKTFSKRLAA